MSEADPLIPPPTPAATRPISQHSPYFVLPPAPPVVVKPIPRWIWIATAALILCILGATIPVYKNFRAQWRKADPLIASLHAKMVQGDDAGIFADSDPAYQQEVGLQKSNHLFDYVRDQLGAPRSSTCIGQNISAKTGEGSILTLTFSTVFDKGTGTETLSLRQSNGVYRMVGYNVQSPQIRQNYVPSDLKPK